MSTSPTGSACLARTGTPQPILDKLAKASVACVEGPQVREILVTQAAEPVGNTPAEFRDFIRAEVGEICEDRASSPDSR